MIAVTQNLNYDNLLLELDALVGLNDLSDLVNLTSYLFHSLKDVNWLGVYIYDGENLVLGPFQGKPACVLIPPGKGVCGLAFSKKESQLVSDVEDFTGHIACDADSKSEIVVPIYHDDKVIGVFDIDSPKLARFSKEDLVFFETVASQFLSKIDWSQFLPTLKKHGA